STARTGQEAASWQRVGGDVRIRAEVSPSEMAALADAGLTASRGYFQPVTTFALGSEYLNATLVAMDESYPTVLSQAGVPDTSEIEQLNALAAARGPNDP